MTPGLVITEGARLRIRQLREDDVPRMAAGSFGGEEGAAQWYAQTQELPDGPGPAKQYVVEGLDGEWIGFTGFGAARDGDAGGYFSIAAPFQGKGYGTELVRLVLQVMFEDCGAARCVIDYHDWNEVAARLYAKFGFREERRVRIPEDRLSDEDRVKAPGKPVHAVVLVLTREEFMRKITGAG